MDALVAYSSSSEHSDSEDDSVAPRAKKPRNEDSLRWINT